MADQPGSHLDPEQQLRSLGGRDDLFPGTPEIAGDVGALIQAQEPPLVARERPRFDWRLVAIIALVVAVLVAALAVPGSRTAIADFFGIEGIRVEVGQDDDAALPESPTSIGGSLLLGERTTLNDVSGTVPFGVVAPSDAAAGEPDEIYLNQRSGVTVVGLLYEAGDELPEIGETGVGMLLLEIDSTNAGVIFVKKTVVGGGDLDMTEVNGSSAYWIEHGVLAVEPVQGLMLDELGSESRRSGNVLIWSDGEITYRLETDLPMEDAVRIAASLEPVEDVGNP